jgi:hypothetical protein
MGIIFIVGINVMKNHNKKKPAVLFRFKNLYIEKKTKIITRNENKKMGFRSDETGFIG